MKNKFALIGRKLGHSYSPTIHEKVFQKLGVKGEYSLIELEPNELHQVVDKLKNEELKGINITIPYKTDIINFLDEISNEAKEIGAVNTVISKNGKLIGYNTDYYGFKIIVERLNLQIKSQKNFICGAGGSARAVIKCLEDLGGENYLVTRNIEKARNNFSNFKNLKIISYEDLEKINYKNLIVNCTPCGMSPNIDCSVLEDNQKNQYNAGIDIIYNPEKTKFLEGFKVFQNGLLMLVGQAIKADEIWLERKIDNQIIDEIYDEIKEEIYN